MNIFMVWSGRQLITSRSYEINVNLSVKCLRADTEDASKRFLFLFLSHFSQT